MWLTYINRIINELSSFFSYVALYLFSVFLDVPQPKNPCSPSPCGPNSQCRAPNNAAVCSCLPGFIGTPPSCRPECVLSSECLQTQACVNNKCTDPCLGSCGLNAKCLVINHSPICSCPPGQTGDPFRSCFPIPCKLYSHYIHVIIGEFHINNTFILLLFTENYHF